MFNKFIKLDTSDGQGIIVKPSMIEAVYADSEETNPTIIVFSKEASMESLRCSSSIEEIYEKIRPVFPTGDLPF